MQKIRLSNAASRLLASSFSGCTALREVNIPDLVTALPWKLFKDAPLERVHIGKGLETLVTDNLGNRPGGLSEITVDPENRHFKAGGPCLYSADGRVLYAFFGEGFFRIPEGVEQIGPGAFSGRKGLTEVVFPSTLTEIGRLAFYRSAVKEVRPPSGRWSQTRFTSVGIWSVCAWSCRRALRAGRRSTFRSFADTPGTVCANSIWTASAPAGTACLTF